MTLPARPSLLPSASPASADRLQGRLLFIAGAFLGLYALALTLSPAVVARSWQVSYRWEHWVAFLVWAGMFTLIHRRAARRLPHHDPYLLPVAALLSGWGLMVTWRLFPSFGLRQTVWLLVTLGLFALGLGVPHLLGFLRRYKYLWLTSGLALTALTFIMGTNPSGAPFPRLWLGCCGVYFQPSEPLKLLLVIYLAAYLADRLTYLAPARGSLLPLLAPTLIMTGLALLMLLAQRDLGTASIFLFLYTATVYITSGSKRILLFGFLAVALAAVAGYSLFDVVRLRVDAWLNPWVDPSGRSYQIVQSLLAVANGGLEGRGPGLGSPGLVPVPHSDFIFAAITEETGLVGALGLLLLVGLFAIRGLEIALSAPDAFRRYLAAGLTAHLAAQSILIIGGNLRLLPLTGVTLPFVSYGGSSLLTSFFSLLVLLHISSQKGSRPASLPDPQPYLQLAGLLLAGLAGAALVTGWWTVVRGPALLTRTDNPRRALGDRLVHRGSILDRNNTPLVGSQMDSSGGYVRSSLYPPLSSVLGYTNPIYGDSGLEASLDDILRGLAGNPNWLIAWNHLLFGQPPPGLDVRLSLDLDLQKIADSRLDGHPGAAVLLNAQSGEILVLASHPTYDANRLEEDWAQLVGDPRAPLLDRAAQGLYTAGAAPAPLLLAGAQAQGALPPLPAILTYTLEGRTLDCAQSLDTGTSAGWSNAVSSGCPGAAAALGSALGNARLLALEKALGFFTPPPLRLDAASSPVPAGVPDPARYAAGQDLRLSPLQVALAAAALTNRGILPPPHLVTAINNPQSGWLLLSPLSSPQEVLPAATARETANLLAVPGQSYWQSMAVAPNGPDTWVTWYLAGSLPGYEGEPLALAIALEEKDPTLAMQIGQALLLAAMQP